MVKSKKTGISFSWTDDDMVELLLTVSISTSCKSLPMLRSQLVCDL